MSKYIHDDETFFDDLTCAYCGTICEDYQQSSKEEYKEEYCGNCDNQFGYEEEIRSIEDWDFISYFEESHITNIRRYRSYPLD